MTNPPDPAWNSLKVSVILCAYTEKRWPELVAAVESIHRQTRPADEVILVIDHHPGLLTQAQASFPDWIVLANQEARGLSGARNTGIAAARGDVLAFMDEDAAAEPGWLEALVHGYTAGQVIGVGGAIVPAWQAGRPAWFPPEFDWVVGCTYQGMPETPAPVRNLIGANMSFRRSVFQKAGGFKQDMGRIGTLPLGCEETELCIRAAQGAPGAVLWYEPQARVHHRVPPERGSWRYFTRRCFSEGISKAQVTRAVGASSGLSTERRHALRVLPRGIWQGLQESIRARSSRGIARAAAIVAGLAITLAGYLYGSAAPRGNARPGSRSPVPSPDPGFTPYTLLEMEISQPLPTLLLPEAPGQPIRLLVRLHGAPIGSIEVASPAGGLSAGEVARLAWQALGPAINAHLRSDGLAEQTSLDAAGIACPGLPACLNVRAQALALAPKVSILVATHNRPADLAACLDSLLALEYPSFDIIVVDNAPQNRDAETLISQVYAGSGKVHYLREEVPGLGRAHNRGLELVQSRFVAITDDDVRVDRFWLAELMKAFQLAPSVGCVTGSIFPAEIQTRSQYWMERSAGFNKGYSRQVYRRDDGHARHPLFPYAAGLLGSGANMAFDTAILQATGGFDDSLGAGTLALGGDDLAAFFQVIDQGYTLIHEPAAIVYHRHYREYAHLQRTAYGYGAGLTAYLAKILIDRPARLLDLALRLPYGLYYALSPRSPKNARKAADYPRELTWMERKGMAAGPFLYLRSRWHTRALHRPAVTKVAPAGQAARGRG